MFVVTQMGVAADSAGTRVLSTKLSVPSVTEANQTIDKVMEWFEATVASLNRDEQAKLGVLHVIITAPSGESVVDWTEDFVNGHATGHWASGITNYWFPVPPVAGAG